MVVEELVVADELITTVVDAGADEDDDEEEPKLNKVSLLSKLENILSTYRARRQNFPRLFR